VPEDTATQVQRYIAAWNETEPQARRRAVAALFTEDARYVDPLVDVRGHEGIEAAIAAAQQQFPGWVFRLAGPVDAHHDQVRFTWSLGPQGGEPPVVGSDVAVTDGDGRFDRVCGFLDRVPQP
jgi:SnoaL-like protein